MNERFTHTLTDMLYLELGCIPYADLIQKRRLIWIWPKDHFKTHLFFSIFGWGDPSQLGSWSYGCVKPLKLSREAI